MNNDEETIYAEGYHDGVNAVCAKTEKAIDMAFQLGQIYFQQADSDSYKQQDKSKAQATERAIYNWNRRAK